MTTRARVAGPIARATSRGSRFRSSAPPTSQNTGVAPVWQIVFAAATKFRDGTMTSSAAPRPGGVVVAIVLAPSGCDVERRRNRDASRRFDPSSNRLLVILAAPDVEPEAFIPVRADGFARIEKSLYEVRKVAPSRGRDVAERIGLEDVDAHADRRGHL